MNLQFIFSVSILLTVVTIWVSRYVFTRRLQKEIFRQKLQISEYERRIEEYEKATLLSLEQYVRPMRALRAGASSIAETSSLAERVKALKKLLADGKVWVNDDNEDLTDEILTPIIGELSKNEAANRDIPLLHQLIDGFYSECKSREVRYLNSYDKSLIRTKLLRLCMMLMDGCQSINYFNYIETEQGVNHKVIRGECTADEAKELSSPITRIDDETPRWARVLHAALEPWLKIDEENGSMESTLILRGFIFGQQ